MRVRAKDQNGDMQFGRSQADFYRDVPEAPTQLTQDRLMLFEGEWLLDITDGTPWNTRVLGKYTGPTRDMVIRTRISTTPGILDIDAYASQVNRDTREFTVQTTLNTAYGRSATQLSAPGILEVTR